jgi:hypothetical protein
MTVRIAAIVWMVFGSLVVLNGFIILAVASRIGAGERHPAASALACGATVAALIGVAFIYVGVQTIRGTARDTLGNGIGSIAFGIYALAFVAQTLVGAVQQGEVAGVINGVLGGINGIALLAAGILALVGRKDYKAWRQSAATQAHGST